MFNPQYLRRGISTMSDERKKLRPDVPTLVEIPKFVDPEVSNLLVIACQAALDNLVAAMAGNRLPMNDGKLATLLRDALETYAQSR